MLNFSWETAENLLKLIGLNTAKTANLNLIKFINSDLSELITDGRGGIWKRRTKI
jgi:hypothetical protein